MFRKFILPALIATSIAAAPIATPAAQARSDLDNILIGLATIGIVGAVIHETNKNNRQTAPVQKRHDHYKPTKPYRKPSGVYQHQRDDYFRKDRHADRRNEYRKARRDRHYNRAIKQCERQTRTRDGWVTFYSQRCLNKVQNRFR